MVRPNLCYQDVVFRLKDVETFWMANIPRKNPVA